MATIFSSRSPLKKILFNSYSVAGLGVEPSLEDYALPCYSRVATSVGLYHHPQGCLAFSLYGLALKKFKRDCLGIVLEKRMSTDTAKFAAPHYCNEGPYY